MALATLVTLGLGAVTGVAWVTGYTLLGLEVDDTMRGRTFAFVQSMVRVVLVTVLVVAPLLAAVFGEPISLQVTDGVRVDYSGVSITFLIAGLLAALLGITSFRQMDDRPGLPLSRDLYAAWRGGPAEPAPTGPASPGFFLAFEGGDGAGKSTQARLARAWLQELGHRVVLTREPGATPLGRRLREVLLDPQGEVSPRAEALLYAADRAHHVYTVIRPALEDGAVVVTDRYVDSSVAYQGAGRALPVEDVVAASIWATGGLTPDLTVVLDVPPAVALRRSAGPADRIEAEPTEFHDRVRREFLRLAAAEPGRYLVVDAMLAPEQVAAVVRQRLEELLPAKSPAPRERSAVADPAESSAAPDLTPPR